MSSSEKCASFAGKLASLNVSAASVETLSHWCVFHRKAASALAQTWKDSFEKAPAKRKLAFLYLASDVVQNCRKKGPEWADALAPLLPGACAETMACGEANAGEKVRKLCKVWGERNCFGSGVDCGKWCEGVGSGGSGNKESASGAPAASAPAAALASAPATKKSKRDLVEVPALSGENATLAKLLVKMEKAERDVAEANERYERDFDESIMDEDAVENSQDPPGMLRLIQHADSALVAKRDAADAMNETLDELEKKLKAALKRVDAARAAQSSVDMTSMVHTMVKCVKIRSKASKKAAAFVAQQIAADSPDGDVGDDAPLPEPVNFDDDAYDPTDIPDAYVPEDSSHKRQKL